VKIQKKINNQPRRKVINDKLSVGPPQMTGEIDAFNVRLDQSKKIEGVQNQQFKKNEFKNILNKMDKENRETSGGTNRKMSERKVDRNPKKFAPDPEKDKKELQPTSNPMAFSQSRVEVEDFDKNPDVTEDSQFEKSAISTNEIDFNASEQTMEMPEADLEVSNSEPVLDQFQSDVMQALKQSQTDLKPLAQDDVFPINSDAVQEQGVSQKSETAELMQSQFASPVMAATLNDQSGAEQQTSDSSQQNSFQPNLQSNQTERSDLNEGFKNEMTEAAEKSDTISTKIDDSMLGHQSTLHSLQNHQTLQSEGPVAAAAGKTLNSAMNSQNTNEIVKQAEFLVKEGGGTAKIRLTPEGMGSVDLQVTMHQGKVQVELNTSDPQAKKLIQESITDLRSSLASHNFNLDHVKINNMSAMADLGHQNFNSHSDARSNLSQQNQNSNWNGEFGRQERKEVPTQNLVNSENRVSADVRTVPMNLQKLQRGYAGMKQGSRLNMVA
jgi:flagellar hook-length control protein FliK